MTKFDDFYAIFNKKQKNSQNLKIFVAEIGFFDEKNLVEICVNLWETDKMKTKKLLK